MQIHPLAHLCCFCVFSLGSFLKTENLKFEIDLSVIFFDPPEQGSMKNLMCQSLSDKG